MDVHRGRFVQYPTQPITAAAFTRAHDLDLPLGDNGNRLEPAVRLALGRKNGDVEIWNPQDGQWIQESIFPGEGGDGQQPRSIDGLLWTQEPEEYDAGGKVTLGQYRLFSFASSAVITEWDLATGTPGKRSSGNFSPVWCFAAQLRWKADRGKSNKRSEEDEVEKSQDIVAGCENGTLVLLSTADGDLQFKRTFVAASGKKAGCMSVVYQNRQRVVAGFSDGIIRVLDVRNGQMIRSMGLGIGIPGAPKVPYVWQVKCLPNGDIISGDSNGEVKFWDGKFYSLTQNVAAHDADCLGLVVSADGRTVFSGSMDGRVSVLKLATNPGGRTSWGKTTHNRIHDGEVKSMAVYDGKKLSVVISGGIDVSPIVNPLREFGKERSQVLPSLPQEPPVTSARYGRLLVSWWDRTVSIWRFHGQSINATTPETQTPRKLVAKMELDIQDKIRNVSISEDGRVLMVSTNSEVKAFQLRRRAESHALGFRRITVPEKIRTFGARLTGFSPDGKWAVVITLDNEIHVMRISPVPDKPKLLRIVGVVELERDDPKEDRQTGLRNHGHTITRLSFASDSSLFAVGDLSGNLDTWALEGHEDLSKPAIDIAENALEDDDSDDASDSDSDSSDDDDDDIVFYGQRWVERPAGRRLPKLDSAPIVMSFRPQLPSSPTNGAGGGLADAHQPRLWVMTARHQVYEFNALEGNLSDWSRKHPTSTLPVEFKQVKSRVMGGIWDMAGQRESIWLYGADWLLMLNVSNGVMYEPARDNSGTKRKGGLLHDDRAKKHKSSGTGIKHRLEHRHVPHSVRRYEKGSWADVKLDASQLESDDEDDDIDIGVIATDLRRPDQVVNGESAESTHRPFWVSHKYRPILGIVPLGDVFRKDGEALELVILERPLQETRSRRI